MNRLPQEKRQRIIHCLVEGCSIRGTARMVGCHVKTVLDLLNEAGDRAARIQDETFDTFDSDHLQLDEVWTFCGMKKMTMKRRGIDPRKTPWGDWYIFSALDTASRAVPVYTIGRRDGETTWTFIRRIRAGLNGSADVEISTDSFAPYERAITELFAYDVDYGICHKEYQREHSGRGRYAPPRVSHVRRLPVCGFPRKISTSLVERHNWSLRGIHRRMTRLSNGFSRKLENLIAQVNLGYFYYNMVRRHTTVRTTPAVAMGATDRAWTLKDLLG